MFNKEIYQDRRKKLTEKIKSGVILFLGHEAMSINFPHNTYRFRQDSNFLYFFGINAPGYIGLIDIDHDKEYLIGKPSSLDDVIWMGEQPDADDFANQSGVKHLKEGQDLPFFLSGREVHFLPPYNDRTKTRLETLLGIKQTCLYTYASVELIKAIVALRSVKNELEISELDKAANVGYKMHVTAMKLCQAGRYEREIAGTIEGIALANGGATSFPIILSQNGHILHNHDHSQQLKKGRLMLTDAGAETEMGYACDFTRTIPVGGQFSTKQKEIYQIVLNAINEVNKLARPNIYFKDLHLTASHILAQGLIDLGLMKGNAKEAVKKGAHALFMPHGLGHMMGLDVHDMEDLGEDYVGYNDIVKRSKQFGLSNLRLGRNLKTGYVITNEPGIYFIPALIEKWKAENTLADFINYNKLKSYYDFGGIRLEDDLLITPTGSRLLGAKRIPITPEEIESTMG